MPKQLTLRGVSDEVGTRLENLSRARGQSVNAVVVEILAAAVGVKERRRHLERYATWSQADLEEFEKATSRSLRR